MSRKATTYVSELDHDVCGEVVDFEGHKRVVRVPH